MFIPEFPESIVSNSEGFDEKMNANGGGVNFYYGIPKARLKYGSHPWNNLYGYFLESPIFRHIQNLTTFFAF